MPDARARPFARARAGRVMHNRHRALWVPVDGRHEVFALSGPRVARPVDCRSAHSKNALKPRSSRSPFARSPRFSLLSVSGDGSRSRAGHPFSHMRSRVLGPVPARSGHKTRLPPSVEADVAEEPEGDTRYVVVTASLDPRGRPGGHLEELISWVPRVLLADLNSPIRAPRSRPLRARGRWAVRCGTAGTCLLAA